jgi:hypothetical protein
MSALNIEKLANAFVTNAIPSHIIGREALDAVNRFEKKHGGLWVGGKVTVTPDGLRFVPNRVNRVVHMGLESTYIPLADIRAVSHEFGWVTGIVVVRHSQGEFRFRCFGAKRVAAILGAHVTAP